mmetsp:Transcript_24682/g.40929  ORF Transcript_24682/g.40929 Transcript_24682/m.40929 type:complete len:200 (-) Transcript_24682:1315-1914(-)
MIMGLISRGMVRIMDSKRDGYWSQTMLCYWSASLNWKNALAETCARSSQRICRSNLGRSKCGFRTSGSAPRTAQSRRLPRRLLMLLSLKVSCRPTRRSCLWTWCDPSWMMLGPTMRPSQRALAAPSSTTARLAASMGWPALPLLAKSSPIHRNGMNFPSRCSRMTMLTPTATRCPAPCRHRRLPMKIASTEVRLQKVVL